MASKNHKTAKADAKREVIPAEAKIKVLAKENPHRGKKAGKIFDLYKTGMTVGQWRERVRKIKGDIGYLHGDMRRGDIAVSMPTAKGNAGDAAP